LDDPCKFVLVEVYKDANASPVAHKETEHYKVWRDTVADMMAVPRTAIKYKNIFPSSASSWDYPTPM
jgi:autoinducer 2-degrading protein